MLTDEELLRDRLGRLLGQVPAGPIPVESVLKRGRNMRIGHRVIAAAAVVIAGAAIAAAVAGLGHIHRHQSSPAAPKPHHRQRLPVQRVFKLADRARHGVIAEGTSKGEGWNGTWRIWIDTHTGKIYDGLVGSKRWTVGSLSRSEHVSGIAAFHNADIEAWTGTYAVVAPDVTKLVVKLNNGQRLAMYPVAAAGHRWVGLLTPMSVYAVSGHAYAGHTELGHMLTFGGLPITWLGPGQSGLQTQTRQIGAGFDPMHPRLRWWAVVRAGPWGYCLSLNADSSYLDPYYSCITPAQAAAPGIKGVSISLAKGQPRWLVGTARPSVAYLRLDIADGTSIRVPTVAVDGQLFYALVIMRDQVVVSWGAYDPAGHRVYGGTGSPPVQP